MFKPLIVLHDLGNENLNNAIASLQNPTTSVSYHTLISYKGDILYLNPPDSKVIAAANSKYQTEQINNSVDDFAYHIGLEYIPAQSKIEEAYTDLQYHSLAWLTAKTGVPLDRIVLHKDIDLSGSKQDPRSFDRAKFEKLWNNYPKTKEIFFGIGNE